MGGPIKIAAATHEGRLLWSLAFVRRLPDGEVLMVDLSALPISRDELDTVLYASPLLGVPALMDIAQRVDIVALAESQRQRLDILLEADAITE